MSNVRSVLRRVRLPSLAAPVVASQIVGAAGTRRTRASQQRNGRAQAYLRRAAEAQGRRPKLAARAFSAAGTHIRRVISAASFLR